jgi:CRISPR/Cas system CMR-associated protein Cmr5 small subunit
MKSELELIKDECSKRYSSNFEIITPELAAFFLDKNLNSTTIRNRSINKKNLKKIENDIINGNWKPDASSIKFDINGVLINGQHTLKAITNIKKSIVCKVERGCDPDSFKVLDSGKARTHKDVLTTLRSTDGRFIEKPKIIAGAINIIYSRNKNHTHITKNRELTNTDISNMVFSNWDFYNNPIQQICKWYSKIRKSIPESWIAAFYYENKVKYPKYIDDFMNILCNGENNCAIIQKFREDLAENKNRNNLDPKKLIPIDIFNRMSILLKYHMCGTLPKLKDFKKSDLK